MMAITYPSLQKAVPQEDYTLLLTFSNGEKKLYDFRPNLNHSFYKDLTNPVLFQKVNVVDGEIEWATGQDFCPYTLYDNSVLL